MGRTIPVEYSVGEMKRGLEGTSVRDRYGKLGFNYDKSESLREELREKYSHYDSRGNDMRSAIRELTKRRGEGE